MKRTIFALMMILSFIGGIAIGSIISLIEVL